LLITFSSHAVPDPASNTCLVQASVMRGSIVEVLAWRGRVEFLLLSEPMAREMHWVNGQAVARTYRCGLAQKQVVTTSRAC
jgi:hypothetical protein